MYSQFVPIAKIDTHISGKDIKHPLRGQGVEKVKIKTTTTLWGILLPHLLNTLINFAKIICRQLVRK